MNNILSDPAAFMGQLEPKFIETALSELYEKARKIKARLGQYGNLIGGYILTVFSAMEVSTLEDAAQEGRCECMGRLLSLCQDILAGTGDTAHPMYAQIKAFMDKHPLPDASEISRTDIYAGALMPSFGAYALEAYYKKYYNELKADEVECIDEVYKAICDRLGTEEPMQELNEIIKKYFLRVPVMAAYLQGFSQDLLTMLSIYIQELEQYTLGAVMDLIGDEEIK